MKAKAKVNATTTTGAKAKEAQTVKVSAATKAAVKAVFSADEAVRAAVDTREGKWEACGKVLGKEYSSREDAATALKTAFNEYLVEEEVMNKDGEQMTASMQPYASYVTKILGFGFPENEKMAEEAKKDGLSTNLRAQVNAGTLAKVKGKWVKVEKKGKRGNAKKSGGHNRKAPFDTFVTALALAFTGADKAQLTVEQVANALYEATKDTRYAPKGNREKLEEAIGEAFNA